MNKDISLSENKTLEVQAEFWKEEDSTWFEFHFEWSKKRDHAGLDIRIEIWRFGFYFSICDNRHWDYEKNQWYVYKGACNGTMTEKD